MTPTAVAVQYPFVQPYGARGEVVLFKASTMRAEARVCLRTALVMFGCLELGRSDRSDGERVEDEDGSK
jgi:hypothetical protein